MAKNIYTSAVVDNIMVGTATVDRIMLASEIVWENIAFICSEVYDASNMDTEFTVLSGCDFSIDSSASLDPFGDGSLKHKLLLDSDATALVGPNGANTGVTFGGAGVFGNCGDWSTPDSSIIVPSTTLTSTSFSYSMFINSEFPRFGIIISFDESGWSLMVANDNEVLLMNGSGLKDTGYILPDDGTWRHLVLTTDGSKTELFIDKAKKSEITEGTTQPTGSLGIGSDWEGDNSYEGLLDQVEIYDKALSQAEIDLLYTQKIPVTALTATGYDGTGIATCTNAETFTTLYPDIDEELFEADYEFTNIAQGSTSNTLNTNCPITNGDNLIIAKNDDSLHEIIASGVTGSGPYSMDTSIITAGEVPSRVFADAKAEFDIDTGYQTAVKTGDVYTLGTTLQTTQSYDNITDAESTSLDTKITLKNIGDKMTKLSFSASK